MIKTLTKIIFVLTLLFISSLAQAQKFVGIGTETPDPRAVLHMNVEDPANYQQGFLPPKLTQAQMTSFGSFLTPTQAGMTVFNTTDNSYYVWDGITWQRLAISGATNLTAIGINGAIVSATGLSFTVNGSNFLTTLTSLITGDVQGSFGTGFTVTGLSGAPLNKSLIENNYLLMFDGTSIVGFNSSALLTTATGTFGPDLLGSYGNISVTGLRGYNIAGTPGIGAEILSFNGTNFVFTTLPSNNAQTTTITSVNFPQLTGAPGSYTIDGTNLVTTTLTGNYDVQGSFATGFTVTGLGGVPLNFPQIPPGAVLQYSGTSVVGLSFVAGQGISITTAPGLMTISGTSASQTITGLNGIQAGPNGPNSFTIDGIGLLNTLTGFAGNIAGPYNAITVTGLQNYSITGVPAAGNVLSFDGTSFVYGSVGQQVPTLTGINGLTVAGTGLSQTIIGQNFFGANGVTVTVNGTNVTITGTSSPFTSTLPGTSYTTDNILIGVTTPAGAGNKLKVAGGDLSAQGQVLLAQSLVNPVGSASVVAFGTQAPMFKTPVYIPAGTNTIRINLNAYILSGAGTADFRIDFGGGVFIDVTGVSSTSVDNIVQAPTDINVAALAGTNVMVKVYGRINGGAEGALLQGVNLIVRD